MLNIPRDILSLRLVDPLKFERKLAELGWDEIGSGDEAVCYRHTPYAHYKQAVVARFSHGQISPVESLNLWKRHYLCYQIDGYFREQGCYVQPHITEPIGVLRGGYYYYYASGNEGFSWEEMDEDYIWRPIKLEEWNIVVSCYSAVGIALGYDTCEAFDGRIGKNVVAEGRPIAAGHLPATWHRIDFGPRSLPIDWQRLEEFRTKSALCLFSVA